MLTFWTKNGSFVTGYARYVGIGVRRYRGHHVDPVVQTFLAARLQLYSSSFLLSIKNINSMLAHRLRVPRPMWPFTSFASFSWICCYCFIVIPVTPWLMKWQQSCNFLVLRIGKCAVFCNLWYLFPMRGPTGPWRSFCFRALGRALSPEFSALTVVSDGT
jgi:hypothetical protein